MVPIATADLDGEFSKSNTDVYPSKDASQRLKELWNRHGDPQSSTYTNSKLDSLPSLIRWNAGNRPQDIAYVIPYGESFRNVTWSQFDTWTEVAASCYSLEFLEQIETGNATSTQPTIALLGIGNTFGYWVSLIALCKLGFRVLLLSDKNADVARDHLLNVCNAVGIVEDPRFRSLQSYMSLQLASIFVPTEEHLDNHEVQPYERYKSKDIWNEHALIIHSSGSTGLPKPIIHTNRSLMLIGRMYRLFQHFVVENWYLCFPMFHIAGVSIMLGGISSALPTTLPPETWPPSPGKILAAWRKLEELGNPVDCLHCAPSVIEDIYEYLSLDGKQDYSPLIKLKILQPGGAALSPVLLKKLTDIGVNVKTTYGSTEIGPPYRTIPDTRNNPDCYYVRSLFADDPLVQMEPQDDGLFECVVYKGFGMAAELWSTADAPNPYRTNDLFLEDPPGSGLFVLQGRKDDILVHSNGEKTNALPLQMAIEESHIEINKVVVFGTDQPCTSAVLELAKTSTSSVDGILEAVSDACKSFPSFSRIDKSMILVLSSEEKLPVTPKGNVRRKEAWAIYGERVEQLYHNLNNQVPDNENSDDLLELDDQSFNRHCVSKISAIPLENIHVDANFYDLGLSSQDAVRLRPRLAQRFGKFPLMYIFEYPSVSQLTAKLSATKQTDVGSSYGRHFPWIQETISRYTAEIASWTSTKTLPAPNSGDAEVVYLTGATGELGSAILTELVQNEKVATIFCAVRGSDVHQRLFKSLQNRHQGDKLLSSGKIVAVPYDMSDPQLGLDKSTHESLASKVTTVIHNAWKMDFNQQVNMFESDCLAGTMSLMRFCQTSARKRFVFISSVASNMGKDGIVQETPMANDPSLSLETGYAQSKFIVEIVSQSYARLTESPVLICRVGQLCGNTVDKTAVWNTTEMFPIMIATGLRYLKAMPTFTHQQVDWLPVNICAEAVNLLMSTHSHSTPYSVHNIVNPSTITWTQFLDALEQASETTFERIDMGQWVSRLQTLSETTQGVPGAKLLGFFEAMVEEGKTQSRFDTSKTEGLVGGLRECGPVDTKLLEFHIKNWGAVGFV